jgi:hypothetical protein
MPTKNALRTRTLVAFDPEKTPSSAQILVLFGRGRELHPLVLESLFWRVSRGERIGLVIGDNRLDEYALARLARGCGFDPANLFAQIEFSRPFTCHQLHHCILDLITSKVDTWSTLYVLGLLETLYDEDIRYADASRLLNDILSRLEQIASQGLAMLVTVSLPPIDSPRKEFVARVIRAADAYWQPSPAAIEQLTLKQAALW